MASQLDISNEPLGLHWPGFDPFLFAAHHRDAYPAGTPSLAPASPLKGRTLGNDFSNAEGFSMYHGTHVPGFPQHPHRGFETVTIVRQGYVDHSDSLGATARFGPGDVQWVTAGAGIVHAEMFPLLQQDAANPLEMFQIWLNLPASHKRAPPHFTMLWREAIPQVDAAPGARVTVIAGAYAQTAPPPPPPHSYASLAQADVAIWLVQLEPAAQWNVPTAAAGTRRTIYGFAGGACQFNGQPVPAHRAVGAPGDLPLLVTNGATPSELLVLQGRPLAEPVAHYGPFVMNSRAELQEAYDDYQRTQFGGWPWPADDPTHPADAGRFARYPDGRIERP